MAGVLVIDDDAELCQLVAEYLAGDGYAVDAVHNGIDGLARALSGGYSIAVLDVMLPDMEGFEVLRRLRAQSQCPVLMLTARGDETDRIVGLEMGADDYLAKPFNPRELSARIDAILRRARTHSKSERTAAAIAVDDISLDRGARIVRRGGHVVSLTTMEFDLLECFLRSAGAVVSRETLVRTILGREFSAFDRGIDTHVSNLRKKLGPTPQGWERIKSVRGVGYQYAAPVL